MAGAGYKLFNTGDVLTAAQVNTYLQEQTVMVFANSTARTTALSGVLAEGMMSYLQDTNAVEVYNGTSWVNVGNAGDITEVQAGVGISIASGTGPIPVITNSSTDLITTAGDILYGTAADTMARLGIGSAGQVLKVNSGATAPEWGAASGGAGNMVEIATGTLSGASVTISSLSTYDNLFLRLTGYTNSTGNGNPMVRINSSSVSYSNFYVYYDASSFQPSNSVDDGIILSIDNIDRTNTAQLAALTLTNCKSTGFTNYDANCRAYTGTNRAYFLKGVHTVSAAVSSLVIFNNGGNWAGGTYTLWGA